jgi:Ni/Co efflux regulator RcnB
MAVAPEPNALAAADLENRNAVPVHSVEPRWDRDRSRDRRRDRRDFRERDRGRYRWEYDRRERWKTNPHPRRPKWKGRRLPRHGRYLAITNYWDYGLRRPPRGHYYVREGNDVFLVLEATRMIIDAFILFELLDRR